MSYLKRFKRPKLEDKKGKVLSVRISVDLHKKFVDHCDELGITVSEGVTHLLGRELKEADDVIQSHTPVRQLSDSVEQTAVSLEYKSKPVYDTSIPRVPKKKVTSSSRFSVRSYSIGKETACPLCNGMTSRSNYSRHIKDIHGYNGSTEEFINEHKEKVLEVLEKQKQAP